MNRKRGTPAPTHCQRGHDNWLMQKRGTRVCKTCRNMRVMEWQRKEATLQREWKARRKQQKQQKEWETKKVELKAEIDRLRMEGRMAIKRILARLAALEQRL